MGWANHHYSDSNQRRGSMLSSRQGTSYLDFTIAIVTVGALTMVFLPQYYSWKSTAHCAALTAELANLAQAEELYASVNETFVAVKQHRDGTTNLPGFNFSPGVVLEDSTGGEDNWTATISHHDCDTGPVRWNKMTGGMI